MKILVYVEPWIERGFAKWKTIWLVDVILPTLKSMIKSNKNIKFETVFLVGDAQSVNTKDILDIDNSRVEVISQEELKNISPNYLDATIKQHFNSFTDSEMRVMVNICKKYIGDFKPDLIYSFMTHVPFLKKLFPETLVLHQEVGMISRKPYPTTYYLDPFGTFSYGYIGRFKKELLELELDDKKRYFLQEFRKIFIDDAIKKNQYFSKEQILKGKTFNYLVLLPLQIDPYFSFNGYVDFKDQFDYLCYVLDNIDSKIGVIITTHSDWDDSTKKHDVLDYINRTYPNAILSDDFRRVRNCSQYLLDIVDAVISISSTVAIQALIFNKPIFAVGNNKQLTNLCEGTDISQVAEILSKNKFKNHDALLYHLLTHYYVLNEPYIMNGKWFYNFLIKCIEKHNQKREFDFYDKIDSDASLLNHYRLKNSLQENKESKNSLIVILKLYIKTTLRFFIIKMFGLSRYEKIKKKVFK